MKYKKSKSAQEIQDDIFRKMSADEKIKLGSDFSTYCLGRNYREGTPVQIWYLKKWLKKDQKTALLRLLGNLEVVR